jgi:hypothetical protein
VSAATRDQLTLDQLTKGDALPTFVVDVTATTVILGALATRDWRPMHHDYKFAVERQGVQDIFLNTPNQAAWFERYLNDWTGSRGRIGRMVFRMTNSVFPGDAMRLTGTVDEVSVDETGCGWVRAEISLTVDGEVRTAATARIALPTTPEDNPWDRRGERWKP